MLNQNIKTIRKNKGYTQEDLANRLHVTRQTISKWEKGYSVPDADMLSRLADELEVSASELLGGEAITAEKSDAVVEQLSRINEQLSIRNRRAKRIWKTIIIAAVIIFIVIPLAVTVPGLILYSSHTGESTGIGITEWNISVDGKNYEYEIRYDKNYNIESRSSEGDPVIDEGLNLDSYHDANKVKKAIESYVEDKCGTFTSETKGRELKE
ncbi:helix-turn-helix transcriptional regulator [Clostridium sp. SY8519]|uniref:helix-turn-helix domain-containing protein n=1 Tax=Clostridium sp. (strain SY8519) TaxID=1042156 RepID=UPI000870B800|nr:helix-turn-helix transcriptional regulator [Clostridium sp. SY8519]